MEEKWENKRIKERNISIWNENILQLWFESSKKLFFTVIYSFQFIGNEL